MLRSLRTRLLLATILVVLIAVGVTALVASLRTSGEFARYQERRPPVDLRAIGYVLANSWNENAGWTGIQSEVEKLGKVAGQRVVLTDTNDVVVGDSDNRLAGQTADPDWASRGVPIAIDGVIVGTIYLDPLRSARSSAEQAFLTAVNLSALLGALVASVAAIIVTLALSGRILRPIQRLTVAAERMAEGDLTVRVPEEPQDEIGHLAAAFNTMAGNLGQQERLRRNMVSDVAHELRTPLTNLRGYLEATRDGIIPPDAALVDNLYEETMLLNRLVSDLQELAQADAGQLTLERQPASVGAIIERAAFMLRPQADAREITLTTDVAPDLPQLSLDQERIGQVLRNLINNAFAHTPPGGRVAVTARQHAGAIAVAVSDTGSGIPAEHLPRVFDRFYRVDRSRARHTGGAGLGLAIVKQLIEAHGGRVSVESAEGAGSTFTFTLPVA